MVGAALLEGVEPVEPPEGLRTRLLAAAEADLREGRHPSTAPVIPPIPFTPGPDPAPVVLFYLLAAAAAEGSFSVARQEQPSTSLSMIPMVFSGALCGKTA